MIFTYENFPLGIEVFGKNNKLLGGVFWIDTNTMTCEKGCLPGDKKQGYTLNHKWQCLTKIVEVYEIKAKDFHWRRPRDYND